MAENSNKTKVQVLGRIYEVDIPSAIYPDYWDFLDEPDVTAQDAMDFCLAMREYTRGNFEYTSPNRSIRAELRQIKMQMKSRRDKYLNKYIQQKEAASRGGNKTKAKLQSADAEQETAPNATPNATPNAQVEKRKRGKEENNTPIAPDLAGAASGGDGFKFLGFLAEHGRLIEASAKWTMPAGCDDIDRERAAWICTDKRMQPQIVMAITKGDGDELKRLTNKQSSGAWSRELWKCCEAVKSITQQQAIAAGCGSVEQFQQIVAHEVNSKRMGDEGTAVFKRMQGKMDYIKQGNKISSLAGFLAKQ